MLATRLTLIAAGLAGAAGIAAAAASSHGGESRNLSAIAMVCLAHGPALLALGLYGVSARLLQAAALLLGLGTLVFSADLMVREMTGAGVLALAAPVGGMLMMLGWLAVIVAAIFRRPPDSIKIR